MGTEIINCIKLGPVKQFMIFLYLFRTVYNRTFNSQTIVATNNSKNIFLLILKIGQTKQQIMQVRQLRQVRLLLHVRQVRQDK